MALAESGLGAGDITLHTNAGVVTVGVKGQAGDFTATLITVPPQTGSLLVLDELLDCLNWPVADLSPELPSGVIEDPATGSAAAALGGFLSLHGLLPASGKFTVLQGFDMGRPSLLQVDASGEGGVRISGTAVALDV